jgi:eukaryotic-like serine/threonine-protein kinase
MPLLEQLTAAVGDRYRVERELGQGGMAVVFLAEDLKHRRRVALKVLKPELSAALGGERFLREIEIAAALQHPHILPLFDSGEAGGLLWYVMPYAEGESVRQRMAREGQLPLDDALRITREAGSGLQYAHQHGVIHRDVKPENVMLTAGQAVVTDFGIARALQAAGGESLTLTGVVVGTPQYMSPEQSAGGAVDGRSDQYSLACTLYEMLVGQPPFTGTSAQAVMARHSLDPVPGVRVVRQSVPPHVEAAVLRAMAKAPVDRFPSAHVAGLMF